MVLTLARALDVPLRERNQLLLAAGYAPHYRETGLDDAAMARGQARAAARARTARALPRGGDGPPLEHHRRQRRGAAALFADLLDGDVPEPANVVRLMFTRLRPYVANFELTGEALIARVHREAVGGIPDPRTIALLDEVLAEPGIPAHWRTPDFAAHRLARSSPCTSSRATSTSATSRS